MGVMAEAYPTISGLSGSDREYHQANPQRSKSTQSLFEYVFSKGSGGTAMQSFKHSITGAPILVTFDPPRRLQIIVQQIRSVFELTMEEFGSACHTQSRKTPYNWVNGSSNPHKDALKRIYDLQLAALAWKDAGFFCDSQVLHVPALNGKSLFDLLRQDKVDVDSILFLGGRLNMLYEKQVSISDPFV
jgi:hypothetical protein